MTYECRICLELSGIAHPLHKNLYSRIVKQNRNKIWRDNYFSIIPSLGPLNQSHLLIVPNRHILSFSDLNIFELNVIKQVKNYLREYNRQKFNSETEFFEHGAGCELNAGGACVAHAHLHSLCINSSIIPVLSEITSLKKTNEKELMNNTPAKQSGYIFIEDIKGNQWMNDKEIFPSQFLRKCYSKILDVPNQWDWRKHFNTELVERVIANYQAVDIPIDYSNAQGQDI